MLPFKTMYNSTNFDKECIYNYLLTFKQYVALILHQPTTYKLNIKILSVFFWSKPEILEIFKTLVIFLRGTFILTRYYYYVSDRISLAQIRLGIDIL